MKCLCTRTFWHLLENLARLEVLHFGWCYNHFPLKNAKKHQSFARSSGSSNVTRIRHQVGKTINCHNHFFRVFFSDAACSTMQRVLYKTIQGFKIRNGLKRQQKQNYGDKHFISVKETLHRYL